MTDPFTARRREREEALKRIDEEADAEVQRLVHQKLMRERNTTQPAAPKVSTQPREVPEGGWVSGEEVLAGVEAKIEEGLALGRSSMALDEYRKFAMVTAELRAFVIVARQKGYDKP